MKPTDFEPALRPAESEADMGELDANDPLRELASLREITPPPALVAKVMLQIAEPAPFRLWDWLRSRKKFEIAFTPLSATAGLLAMGLVVVVAGTNPAGGPNKDGELSASAPAPVAAPDQARAAAPEVVMVRFVLTAKGAQRVSLAGDFNGWNPSGIDLSPSGEDGTFVATIPLPRGTTHEYMFVVDGQWIPDPAGDHQQPDGFGRQNSVLRL